MEDHLPLVTLDLLGRQLSTLDLLGNSQLDLGDPLSLADSSFAPLRKAPCGGTALSSPLSDEMGCSRESLPWAVESAQFVDPASASSLSQQAEFGCPLPLNAVGNDCRRVLGVPTQQATLELFPVQQADHVPPASCVATATLRSDTMGKRPTSQLTIFYSGMVNVYEDVPTEVVQIIMQLAGSANFPYSRNTVINGPSVSSNSRVSSTPVTSATMTEAVNTTVETADGYTLRMNASTFQSVVAPMLTLGSSTSLCPDITPAPAPQTLAAAEIRRMPPRRSQADLPLARKASLARFLQKRRDRVLGKAITSEKNPNFMDEADSPPSEISSSTKRQCLRSPSFSVACWM
eukprot:c22633_g2_i1 orf=90-1130(+)